MRTIFLLVHVSAGALGLVLGPLAMVAPKRLGRHTAVGLGYQVAVALLTLSALGLAALDPASLWGLALVALATQAAAAGGLWVRRRAFPGWLPWHVQLMCGSYVSFLTGFLVVNLSHPVAWVLPTLVASPFIARATSRVQRTTATTGA